VAEGVSEECLADAYGTDDGHVRPRFDEAQAHQLVEQGLVERGVGARVPALQDGVGIEAGLVGTHGGGDAVASRHFVAEGEQQKVLARHLLRACQDEALGQRIEQPSELESPEHGFELRLDDVSHVFPPPSPPRRRAKLCAGRR
jgi:hypothetical protein